MSVTACNLTNPFSAARLRPGMIEFIFEHGTNLAQLVDALEANRWRGEITGRHGTGKSTLLAALVPAIKGRGRIVKAATLAAGQRKLPDGYLASLRDTARLGVAVIDGIEQLGLVSRWRLKRCCKVQGIGLLVTSHGTAGLPCIYKTTIDVPRAWMVVQRFQDGFSPLVKLSDLVERLAQRQLNLREALFDLYDVYEARRLAGSAQARRTGHRFIVCGDALMTEGFQLVFQLAGNEVVRAFDQDRVLIGRSTVCQVVFPQLSRKHAEIVREIEGWTIHDLHSRHGTEVNGEVVSSRRLITGDRIVLAPEAAEPAVLGFRLLDPPSGAASRLFLGDDAGTSRIIASIDLRELEKSLSETDRTKLAALLPPHVAQKADVAGPSNLGALALLKSAGEILLAHETLDAMLSPIVDLIAGHLPGRRVAVCTSDQTSSELTPRSFNLDSLAVAARPFEISRTVLREAVSAGKALLVASAADDPRFLQAASIQQIGIRSAICVPLYHEGRIEGAIYVDSKRDSAALSGSELEVLTVLGLMLASGIAQLALRNDVTRERAIRARLARYNSPQVVERIMRSTSRPEDEMLADEYEVSVLFADLGGFTALAESWSAAEAVQVLNLVFERWTADVFARDGTLDKYIGDAVMAVFGAPLRQPDHAVRAVATALAMQQSLLEINRTRPQQAPLSVRIGVNSGRVIAGDIGSPQHRAYTVIGDAVNIASRLESSISRAGEIVIGQATFQQVQDVYSCQPLGPVQLRGRRQEIEVYRVIGGKQ